MSKKEVIEEKQKLLEMSEISLWLDTYDDIFSDFDSRPYSERAVSTDFLEEAKRASRDKEEGSIELNFLIPQGKKNPYYEALIKKRLKNHFKKHYSMLKTEINNIIKKGTKFTAISIILMIIATYISFYFVQKSFFVTMLVIILEPAGWFLFWVGLEHILFVPKRKNKNLEFYKKMAKCKINFLTY